ncbi:MAG: hypothetical protein ACREQX_10975 [Candidatus Binataceae bacterium]
MQVRPHSRYALLALAIFALLAALWAGLLRLGWSLPPLQPGLYLAHGPLMVSGFLGTLISLERAVAVARKPAYLAPALTALGALALIFNLPDPVGAVLITAGSAALLWNFAIILRRQTALFTVTMTLGALAWLIGNCLWLFGEPIPLMVFWWAAFLVLTITGERLELSRMMKPTRLSRVLFATAAIVYLSGIATASFRLAPGMRVAAIGVIVLALWLALYDVARRTVYQKGLTRFIAASLLGGYAWLAASGVLWFVFAGALAGYRYDAMLHSVFLGFVFSMIFAHAPLIFPAVTGKSMPYRRSFYVHVVLLHLSLLLRIVGGDLLGSFPAYQWGGLLNVVTLLIFLGNTGFALMSAPARTPSTFSRSVDGGQEMRFGIRN